MIWVLVSLAVAMAGVATTAVVLAVKLGNERAASAKLAAQLSTESARGIAIATRLDHERDAHADTKTRLEKVITDLKATNKVLEEEVALSVEPSVVAGRLVRSGLFVQRGTEEGAAPATGAAAPGRLPGLATTPMGSGGRGDGHT